MILRPYQLRLPQGMPYGLWYSLCSYLCIGSLQQDDINSGEVGKFGDTLRCWVTSDGYKGVVEIVLRYSCLNSDKQGKNVYTLLY